VRCEYLQAQAALGNETGENLLGRKEPKSHGDHAHLRDGRSYASRHFAIYVDITEELTTQTRSIQVVSVCNQRHIAAYGHRLMVKLCNDRGNGISNADATVHRILFPYEDMGGGFREQIFSVFSGTAS
jgi:hypothetical protein